MPRRHRPSTGFASEAVNHSEAQEFVEGQEGKRGFVDRLLKRTGESVMPTMVADRMIEALRPRELKYLLVYDQSVRPLETLLTEKSDASVETKKVIAFICRAVAERKARMKRANGGGDFALEVAASGDS